MLSRIDDPLTTGREEFLTYFSENCNTILNFEEH